MATENPFEYYSDEEKHGSYQFVGIEEIVNNFTQNYLGDDTLLGYIPRSKVVYQAKQGIKEFTFGALRNVKVVELELGDNLDIIKPYDYVDYVRISWVNKVTGRIMPMSVNRHTPLGIAHLQDNEAEILFDSNGEVLMGTTAIEAINDVLPHNNNDYDNVANTNGFGYFGWGYRYRVDPIWNLDTTKNFNGTFNVSEKRIHFSSESAERIILLEYVSDGNELIEKDLKVHKICEEALYDFIHNKLAQNSIRLPDYEKRRLKKAFDTSYRNARVRMLGIKPQEFIASWRQGKEWIR
jgi:hypothetical protein